MITRHRRIGERQIGAPVATHEDRASADLDRSAGVGSGDDGDAPRPRTQCPRVIRKQISRARVAHTKDVPWIRDDGPAPSRTGSMADRSHLLHALRAPLRRAAVAVLATDLRHARIAAGRRLRTGSAQIVRAGSVIASHIDRRHAHHVPRLIWRRQVAIARGRKITDRVRRLSADARDAEPSRRARWRVGRVAREPAILDRRMKAAGGRCRRENNHPLRTPLMRDDGT